LQFWSQAGGNILALNWFGYSFQKGKTVVVDHFLLTTKWSNILFFVSSTRNIIDTQHQIPGKHSQNVLNK
jgi:hypothetical protein